MATATFGVCAHGLPKHQPLPRPRAKVLCIDDDPNMCDALARYLRQWGVEVLRAYFGMQGYWLAVTEKPDAILLDLAMPKGAGDEILECLKENSQTARIPVAVITGKQEPGLDRRMYKLGANAFFTKPVNLDMLVEVLSGWFDLID